MLRAIREMRLSAHEVVDVGDVENAHSFLDICACAVAVDNAVAAIKATVDFCTREAHGLIRTRSEKLVKTNGCEMTRWAVHLAPMSRLAPNPPQVRVVNDFSYRGVGSAKRVRTFVVTRATSFS
jgi:hypothetical protein